MQDAPVECEDWELGRRVDELEHFSARRKKPQLQEPLQMRIAQLEHSHLGACFPAAALRQRVMVLEAAILGFLSKL
jgi:hypothetical protein